MNDLGVIQSAAISAAVWATFCAFIETPTTRQSCLMFLAAMLFGIGLSQ